MDVSGAFSPLSFFRMGPCLSGRQKTHGVIKTARITDELTRLNASPPLATGLVNISPSVAPRGPKPNNAVTSRTVGVNFRRSSTYGR